MARPPANIEEVRNALNGCGDSIKAVSFDVFDTVVQRTLPHPDFTKIPAARKLKALLAGESIDAAVSQLLQMRLDIESRQRQEAARRGCDPECRIDVVFREWISRSGLDPVSGLIDSLIEAEISAEQQVVFASRGMPELLSDLKERGMALFYVTDMYLRQGMVKELLQRCGLAGVFDRGYVSCEVMAGKYSGKLFRHILDREGLAANEIIHVGDRAEADVAGARAAGVESILFADSDEARKHAATECVTALARRNRFWEGAKWGRLNIATKPHAELCRHDMRYRIGYAYLGPLFCNFMHQAMDRLASKGADLALLNSREGFLLKEIYHRIAAAHSWNRYPPARYAYLTRKSVYGASLKSFGDRERDMGFHTTTPSLRNMCIRFSLPVEEVEPVVKECGFDSMDSEIHDPWKCPELDQLAAHPAFLRILEAARSNSASILYDYLDQIDYWNAKEVAVIDVGWNGTAQEALAVAFSDLPEAPRITGYYMALLGGKIFGKIKKSRMEGIYHDYRDTTAGIFFSRYLELFETACRAPHPTVIGFDRVGDGQVVPELKSRQSVDFQLESNDDALVSSLQSGILDYTDDYAKTLPFHEQEPVDEAQYHLYQLDRLLRFPAKGEARELTGFSHSEDFGQSLVHVATGNGNWDDPPPVSKKVRHRVLWPEGDKSLKPIPGLALLSNLYRLARTRRY